MRLPKGFSWRRQHENASDTQQMEHATHPPPRSGKPVFPTFPEGIKVLYDCADAAVDICFVHGLTGDRERTWTAEGQSIPWPQVLLPAKLDRARILTYGYDAYIVRTSVASTNRLIDHATNLLVDLASERDLSNSSSRPLIFVAHSLGGLVCKRAILLSRNNPELPLRTIFAALKGVVFMGTPHKGAWMADWARIPVSTLGLVKSSNVSLLDVLQRNNQLLESVQVDFLAMMRQLREEGRGLEITCFFEELPVPGAGVIVSKESATFEGYAARSIYANHGNMVKFATAEDNGFRRLLWELSRWTSNSDKSPPVHEVINQATSNTEDQEPPRDLQMAHCRDDRSRIENPNIGLVKDLERWILENDDYKRRPNDKGPQFQALQGHSESLESLAWSPRKDRLASGSVNNTIRIWDPATGQCTSTLGSQDTSPLEGNSNLAISIAWSPDGSRLASGSHNHNVDIWEPYTGRHLWTLKGHTSLVLSISWSPDTKQLASGSDDNTVRIWELATTAQCKFALVGHKHWVRSVAWSRDGYRLASASYDNTIKIWNSATGDCLSTLEGHSDWIRSIAWSPKADRVASGSNDNTVRVWDPASGKCTMLLEGHRDWVRVISWSPTGGRLASGSYDNTVRIWDLASGQCTKILEGHRDWVRVIDWSPQEQRLASGSCDHTIRIWNPASGLCTTILEGHKDWVRSIKWSPGGNRLASASDDDTVRSWHPARGICTLIVGICSPDALPIWNPPPLP